MRQMLSQEELKSKMKQKSESTGNSFSILNRELETNCSLGTGNNEPLVLSPFSWTESLAYSKDGW